MAGIGSSCGACKFLRRKCADGCIFAPYFCHDQGATHFSAVHKVFGASNVSKLLSHLPSQHRAEAAITVSYEALARVRDPVYGCVAHIFALQQQVANLQEEIELLANQLAGRAIGFQIPSTAESERGGDFHGNVIDRDAAQLMTQFISSSDNISLNDEALLQQEFPYIINEVMDSQDCSTSSEYVNEMMNYLEEEVGVLPCEYPWLECLIYGEGVTVQRSRVALPRVEHLV
ncbi:LOB domain-containing protein 29 [Acorus gramineus]|uniref:LOB domain-containing protein 29 n=1 Tax=Acorus gramineus TaxID=55184 RepID=A0AAV9B1N0_ACOGR|nr:LOB domain-containing protein 29 [Acorus gramineus]